MEAPKKADTWEITLAARAPSLVVAEEKSSQEEAQSKAEKKRRRARKGGDESEADRDDSQEKDQPKESKDRPESVYLPSQRRKGLGLEAFFGFVRLHTRGILTPEPCQGSFRVKHWAKEASFVTDDTAGVFGELKSP